MEEFEQLHILVIEKFCCMIEASEIWGSLCGGGDTLLHAYESPLLLCSLFDVIYVILIHILPSWLLWDSFS